jgi:hypothetical protein
MDLTDFRQAREGAAWLLLVAAAILVGIGIWMLLGLPGSSDGPTLADHVEAASGYLVGIDFTLLPVGAVLLAALGGTPAGSLRQIVLLALIVQLVALALGVIAWLISIGSASGWFTIADLTNLIAAVAGLIVTNAVMRSRTRRA